MSGYPQEIKKAGPVASDVIGWHNMYWPEGQLKVCFRPGGQFFCADEKYREESTWHIFDEEVLIDWHQYGRYALSVDEGKHLKGRALSKTEADPTSWRKTIYFGALSPVEQLLFGDGEGTEWEFKGPEAVGNLSVEFRCDGNNHFVCHTRPGDAHWSLDKKGKTITIDWGKNGKYELDIDLKNKTMDGYHIRDGVEDPDEETDWRKMEFKKNLSEPKIPVSGGDDGGQAEGHGHSHGDGHGHSHGVGHGSHDQAGGIVSLGNLTMASETFMVDREGQVDKGFQTTFGVERFGPGKATGFTAWVQDGNGQQISDPVAGDGHDDHFHFTVMPKASGAEMFAISYGDKVSAISLHPGAAPASDGILSPLQDEDGKLVGFIELKLHDDAGDLELFLCKDGAMSEPLDFPANTSITVTFATHDNRSVQLSVRNNDQNEDEDGNPTMRDGKTNYFIFPGESGQDPTWLQGEEFRSTTTVTFKSEEKTYTAPPFILVPHSHD